MSEELDVGHLQSWIGREERLHDVLTADLVRKYRATLELPEGALEKGEIAPRLIHFCLAQPAAPGSALGPDGHPRRGGFLPPVPLPRRMWAGGSITFHGNLRVGDSVQRVSRILDVALKSGRSGRLCFVKVEHLIEVDGRPVLEEIQDVVYRDLDSPGGPAKPTPEPAPVGTHVQEVTPTPPLLFRYSALTFNGHRIHYDQPYATQVEGYPGLVVHGPLLATQLFNFAAETRGRAPSRFSFRGLSPLFDIEPYTLNARLDEDKMVLWTARQGGPFAMTAEAFW